jgi:hypothetical protein
MERGTDHFPIDTPQGTEDSSSSTTAGTKPRRWASGPARKAGWVQLDGSEPQFTPAHWSALPEPPEE